jgi:excisionase family DNA binding protein
VTEKLLTPEDVAELLGKPRLFVVRQARNGDIPAIKLGKAWRFRRTTIEAWLAKKEQNTHDGAIR